MFQLGLGTLQPSGFPGIVEYFKLLQLESVLCVLTMTLGCNLFKLILGNSWLFYLQLGERSFIIIIIILFLGKQKECSGWNNSLLQ